MHSRGAQCSCTSTAAKPHVSSWDIRTRPPEPLRLRFSPQEAGCGDAVALPPIGFRVNNRQLMAPGSGLVFHDGAYFIEVMRRSMYKQPVTEPYGGGWWHFDAPGSGIFLKVGRVLDFTCPAWLRTHLRNGTRLPDVQIVRIRATGRIYHPNFPKFGKFTKDLMLACRRQWCVPEDCSHDSTNATPPHTLNRPAHWEHDPPIFPMELNRGAYGITTVIAYWSGHQPSVRHWCEAGPKVVVDMRPTGVTEKSYVNGSKRIPCPNQHHYYVRERRFEAKPTMKACQCNNSHKHLNCNQLSSSLGSLSLARSRVVGGWKNGSLIGRDAPCASFLAASGDSLPSIAKKLESRGCDASTSYVLWSPPGSGTNSSSNVSTTSVSSSNVSTSVFEQ